MQTISRLRPRSSGSPWPATASPSSCSACCRSATSRSGACFTQALTEVSDADIALLCERYFPQQHVSLRPVRSAEQQAQRQAILRLFGYRLCTHGDHAALALKARELVLHDTAPAFLFNELAGWLEAQHIVRPGYTTFQTLVSRVLSEERERLTAVIEAALTESARPALEQLLVREDTLSALAVRKQVARHFRPQMLDHERRKRAVLEPIYPLAGTILVQAGLSQQNIACYASFALYYTIYDLRRMPRSQAFVYLLCYAWQRYWQLNDNLADALRFHAKKLGDDSKVEGKEAFAKAQIQRQKDTPQVGQPMQPRGTAHRADRRA
ncbi:DUF4158 domain-containing protein [Paraburkholderia aspalathi]